MVGIDQSLPFYPLRIAVLTVSDTRDEQTDKSGVLLAERLAAAGHELVGKAIVRDDVDASAPSATWPKIRERRDHFTADGFCTARCTPEAIKFVPA